MRKPLQENWSSWQVRVQSDYLNGETNIEQCEKNLVVEHFKLPIVSPALEGLGLHPTMTTTYDSLKKKTIITNIVEILGR